METVVLKIFKEVLWHFVHPHVRVSHKHNYMLQILKEDDINEKSFGQLSSEIVLFTNHFEIGHENFRPSLPTQCPIRNIEILIGFSSTPSHPDRTKSHHMQFFFLKASLSWREYGPMELCRYLDVDVEM